MGFISLGKTSKWRFTEDKTLYEENLIELLEKFLEEKELVTFDEVMDLIKEKDMPYKQGTILGYLQGMCYVDETGTKFFIRRMNIQNIHGNVSIVATLPTGQ